MKQYSSNEKEEIASFCAEMLGLLEEGRLSEFLDGETADCFFRFGFVMDCGESWIRRYGERSFNDPEAMEEVRDKHDCLDISFLGSAIFSQWRYWSHWACSSPGVDICRWFTIAFRMLYDACVSDESR